MNVPNLDLVALSSHYQQQSLRIQRYLHLIDMVVQEFLACDLLHVAYYEKSLSQIN